MEPILLRASEESKNQRLDAFLASSLDGLTRSQATRLIESDEVAVNGRAVGKSYKLAGGEDIAVTLPEPEPVEAVPQDIPLDVVYEDADVIVVNKPSGMVVHPAPGHPDGTLVNALLYHCAGTLSGIGGALRPGIVHRIDRDTSGLIIAAKNDAAHQYLSAQLADHTLARTYECIVVGALREDRGTVDAPIARHPTDRKRMAVVAGGREAVTHWEVIARYPGYTHVRCRLETGRTHQIRVHMAHVGHPLLGDALYAPAPVAARAPRQMLHAWHISFCHPLSGGALEFFCPPPDDMLRTILNNSSRMQRLVITGNPGCGKSTLTHALEKAGLPTVSADALVAQLYAAGGEMADYLGRRFGERLLEDDGSVCKPALLEAMQQDPGLRKEVEQMVHALVRDAILAFWDKAEAEGKDCAVAEIPLYFECGWHKAGLPGALSLTVRCPREIRLQRIMATRGWSEEKAATLEAWQWPAERKEAASDLAVDNAGTPADLRARIPALLEQLTALRQQAQDDILRQVTACWQVK